MNAIRAPGAPGVGLQRELGALVGSEAVLPGDAPGYATDATEGRGVRGQADAVVLPQSSEEVAEILRWCYDRGVPVTPRGGGSGFGGGAVPVDGGVVICLQRHNRVRELQPERWRMQVEAGVRTAQVQRLARENGLFFPPDPGAAEQSQIGGNLATNAGGPHAFKYGPTGRWVTGVEAVVPPGEIVSVGGAVTKDVAGYDLKSLLVGSEGTLGIITAAWLRLIPAPEAQLPVTAFYPDIATGCAAIDQLLGSGLQPAVLEYLDELCVSVAGAAYPGAVPEGAGLMVLCEADGAAEVARGLRQELIEALEPSALAVEAPESRADREALWRWRDGISLAVSSVRGGKVSEDICVPVENLAEAIEATLEIGRRHRLEACSWGHAGDGNLHPTFLVAHDDEAGLAHAALAAQELFELAVRLGGSVSGEHGLGWVRSGQLERQWSPRALQLHDGIKRAFDPKGLLNPGKKSSRLRREPARGEA
jgi:glycolate oxidase subunit GlcD